MRKEKARVFSRSRSVLATSLLSGLIVMSGPPGGALAEQFDPVIDPVDMGDVIIHGECGDKAALIRDVRSSGLELYFQDEKRTIEGIVTQHFVMERGEVGFFVQEEDAEVDNDPTTTEAIFIRTSRVGDGALALTNPIRESNLIEPSNFMPNVGDTVRVTAKVGFYKLSSRYVDMYDLSAFTNCGVRGVVTPVSFVLPVENFYMRLFSMEGMLVEFPQQLKVVGNSEVARFGVLMLAPSVMDAPTNVLSPGEAAHALHAQNRDSLLLVDDGRFSRADPVAPYLFDDDGRPLRSGTAVESFTGIVVDASRSGSSEFGGNSVVPIERIQTVLLNPRPIEAPDVGGSIQVASVSLNGYGSTRAYRAPGADLEKVRQRDKLISAVLELDAEIVGLTDLANVDNDRTTAEFVNFLNERAGGRLYDYVPTDGARFNDGGASMLRVALIYKPAYVELVGGSEILDSSVDANYEDRHNPAIAQTFSEIGTDDKLTVAVGQLDRYVYRPEYVESRDRAAQVMASWLNSDPTGAGDGQFLLLAGLGGYAMSTPVSVVKSNDYVDLIAEHVGVGRGDGAYSFTGVRPMTGAFGYLDHGLASPELADRVTDADLWHINSDESSALDYSLRNPDGFYRPDPFRSSDTDPLLIGICETTAPLVEITVSQEWIVSQKTPTSGVTAEVRVTDADPNSTVTLTGVTAETRVLSLFGHRLTQTDVPIVKTDEYHFSFGALQGWSPSERTYTVSYEVVDGCGNATTATAKLSKPGGNQIGLGGIGGFDGFGG